MEVRLILWKTAVTDKKKYRERKFFHKLLFVGNADKSVLVILITNIEVTCIVTAVHLYVTEVWDDVGGR